MACSKWASSQARVPTEAAKVASRFRRIPGAAYPMAQASIVQRQALKQAEAQLNQLRQGGGSVLQQQCRQAPVQPTSGQSGGGILIADAGMASADSVFGDSFDADDLFDAYEAGLEDAASDLFDDAGDFGDFDLGMTTLVSTTYRDWAACCRPATWLRAADTPAKETP